jgi:beta-glucosidase
LYIQDVESSIDRPVKGLKGFDKVSLEPGETKTIKLEISKKDLSFWRDEWVAEPGKFNVLIGASATDIKLNGSFDYK